jgi:hypothetical protein
MHLVVSTGKIYPQYHWYIALVPSTDDTMKKSCSVHWFENNHVAEEAHASVR